MAASPRGGRGGPAAASSRTTQGQALGRDFDDGELRRAVTKTQSQLDEPDLGGLNASCPTFTSSNLTSMV